MARTAIVTDSNSGIRQSQAEEYGVYVIPMPFYIDGELYYEDINLTQEEFYKKLEADAQISTSMPAVGDVLDLWKRLLETYDEVVYIPMSSGLSSSCHTAQTLAEESFEDKVFVVNNQRISVTQRQSVLDAKILADKGWGGREIKKVLEDTRFDASIYITLDTLKYLKKGGRITPAAAAIGTLLHLKPVLQIQGEIVQFIGRSEYGRSIVHDGHVIGEIGGKPFIGTDEIGQVPFVGDTDVIKAEGRPDIAVLVSGNRPDAMIQPFVSEIDVLEALVLRIILPESVPHGPDPPFP